MAELHLEHTYEKQLPAEVNSMVWSPKMDLIAFSLVSGGVALYRMTLHRVWSVEPPEEGVTVSALCWRPDGRVLAVAYTSGLLQYLDLESGESVHSETFPAPAVCLSWAQLQLPEDADRQADGADDPLEDQDDFLPPLPSLSKQYGSVNRRSEDDPQDVQGIAEMKSLTVLAVGTRDGEVTLLLHGLLVFGRHSCGIGVEPRAMAFSSDLSRLLVLGSERSSEPPPQPPEHSGTDAEPAAVPEEAGALLLQLDLSVLSRSAEQLRQLATLYGRLGSHLVYLDRTIQAICEAWETVLVEMDSKMERFQASLGENSSLSVEFLELLMFGVPSPEMEQFLLNDLTDTGLKKLRHSIELSYTNIQSLVLRHLQAVGLRMADLLDQVAGMARHSELFGHLGLSLARVSLAQRAAALFLVKATEIQQVIDSSTRNFMAFFRWLYVVILRLAEVTVPTDCVKISQNDLSFIAQFIDTNLGASATARGVHLERVGMYLRGSELEAPPGQQSNSWRRLLADSPALAAAPGVVPPTNGGRSLLQERDALRAAVADLLADTGAAGSRTVAVAPAVRLARPAGHLVAVSAVSAPAAFLAVLGGERWLHVVPVGAAGPGRPAELRLDALLARLGLTPPAGAAPQLRQLAFFSGSVLSALATDAGPPAYLQLQLAGLLDGQLSAEQLASDPAVCCAACQLDNIAAAALAVSGARHLVAVLFKGGRRARVYDTADSEPDESVLETTAGSVGELMDDNKENLA